MTKLQKGYKKSEQKLPISNVQFTRSLMPTICTVYIASPKVDKQIIHKKHNPFHEISESSDDE